MLILDICLQFIGLLRLWSQLDMGKYTSINLSDITPISDIEKLYAIFAMILSCGVFGYSINTLGNAFTSMD